MKRREFITLLGGAAAAWPVAARAQQQQGRVRRIGVLMNLAADDPEGQLRLAAFLQGLQEAGWAIGRNAQIDIRWGAGDSEQMRKQVAEMVALAPDVILASSPLVVVPLRDATRTIPIVFVAVVDPVASGFVESLARPGGNTTGFTSFDYSMSAKWLELLKDIAPQVAHAAVLYGPRNPGGLPMFTAIQVVAPSLRVELSSAAVRDAGEIERAVAALARFPNGGLIVTRTTEVMAHGDLIVALAARHRLPTVYPLRSFVTRGGLISYGNDVATDYRMAASYIDRIFKGEKPADLPVQYPTKYDLVINLKTAKALGLDRAALVARPRRRGDRMSTRREFITLLGGAAAWPVAARAEQRERTRRIGVLLPAAADDTRYQTWVGAFLQGLALSGWSIGQNVRIDTRWATANADAVRRYAAELVASAPDVILAPGASTVGPLLQVTRTVPIVFAVVADPVGAGFVESLAQPGGNTTGFTVFEYGIAGKWLELLKQIAPNVTTNGSASGSRHTHWDRPVRCNPVRRAVARGGGEPGQCPRRRRDRACS